MSTTYLNNTGFAQPANGDPSWDVTLNGNWALLETLLSNLAVRPAEIPSASLDVKVAPGTFSKQSNAVGTYAGTTSYAVPPSATTYLWLTEAAVLSSGTAWPTSPTFHVRLAVIVAGTSTITGVTPALFIPRSVSS